MKLYEQVANYRHVEDLLDDPNVDRQTILDTLEAIEGGIEVKAGNIAHIIRGMDADIEAIKAEEKRLAERRKAEENRREGLKRYLQDQMELAGLDKVKTPTVTLSLQKNPPSVKIVNMDSIPEQFLKVEVNPDKKKILAFLKSGLEVLGCELETGNKSLWIR